MKQFWYIEKKENQKFAMVGCSNWAEANSRIEFEELAFYKNDDFYHVFAYATAFTEIAVFGDKNWTFQPQFIKFKFATKDYQKEDKDKNKVDVKQSRLEKWLCSLFDELEEGKFFKGWLNLKDDPYCDIFVSKELKGIPIDQSVLSQMMMMSVEMEEITPSKLTAEDITVTSSSGGFGGKGFARGQSELEKIEDRLKFLLKQVEPIAPQPINNLHELCTLMENPELGGKLASILQLVGDLIH